MARLIKSGIYLDIYYYELSDDGTMVVDPLVYDPNSMGYVQNVTAHNYDDIFPLKRCMCGGIELTCPRNSLKFIETVYDTNVMVPKYKCVNSTWIAV